MNIFYFLSPHAANPCFKSGSLIRRLHDFLCRNFNTQIAKNLSLEGHLLISWHGIGVKTVSETREYDLRRVVEKFAPNVHVVIIQLGTNKMIDICQNNSHLKMH